MISTLHSVLSKYITLFTCIIMSKYLQIPGNEVIKAIYYNYGETEVQS